MHCDVIITPSNSRGSTVYVIVGLHPCNSKHVTHRILFWTNKHHTRSHVAQKDVLQLHIDSIQGLNWDFQLVEISIYLSIAGTLEVLGKDCRYYLAVKRHVDRHKRCQKSL